MPEISRFYGIVITMNYREHNPPHFHAIYQDYEISVDIETGVVKGQMSKRALRMIFEWLELYKKELLYDWTLAQDRKSLVKIPPLA
ncbi:MAG: DUF4160 domain-containing protein [Melioribacteraceae bacterium]